VAAPPPWPIVGERERWGGFGEEEAAATRKGLVFDILKSREEKGVWRR
jgi:hypothetical protein